MKRYLDAGAYDMAYEVSPRQVKMFGNLSRNAEAIYGAQKEKRPARLRPIRVKRRNY